MKLLRFYAAWPKSRMNAEKMLVALACELAVLALQTCAVPLSHDDSPLMPSPRAEPSRSDALDGRATATAAGNLRADYTAVVAPNTTFGAWERGGNLMQY